jgi:hypothetical protein
MDGEGIFIMQRLQGSVIRGISKFHYSAEEEKKQRIIPLGQY